MQSQQSDAAAVGLVKQGALGERDDAALDAAALQLLRQLNDELFQPAEVQSKNEMGNVHEACCESMLETMTRSFPAFVSGMRSTNVIEVHGVAEHLGDAGFYLLKGFVSELLVLHDLEDQICVSEF